MSLLNFVQGNGPSTPPRSPHTEVASGAGLSFPFFSKSDPKHSPPPPPNASSSVAAAASAIAGQGLMSGLTVSNSAGATSRRPSTEGAAQAAAEAPYQPGPSNPFHPALRTRSRRSMHFGRRDVVLCALTFLLAWLLFGTRGSSTSERNEYGYSYSTTLGGRPSSRVISGNRDDSGAKGSYAGSDKTDDSADVASLTGKFGKWGSKLGLAGWLGSSEAVRGHGQGDLGVEMVCEIGKDGMVKMHGYSDSVAKHPIVPSHIVDQVDADADVFDEADAPGLTRLVAHQPGWTVFENLYLSNGTLWVVTDDASSYPELRLMTSTGLPASSEPGNEEAREPTGEEIQFITPSKAAAKWGDRIWEMEGVTWLFNDGQFIDHYYHFAAELLLGMWRTYASLGRSFEPDGSTTLPAPARAWFIRMTEQTWRDKPRFNPTILWSAFPSISVLYQDDWHDIKRSTSSGQDKAYLLPRAVLADRSAAFRGQATSSTSRTVASALHVGDPGPWWWEPVRRQVLRFAGVSDDVLDISLEGYGAVNPAKFITEPDSLKEVTPPARDPLSSWQQLGMKPLVTYISRQSSRRRLTPESHADLVAALTKHSEKAGWDLNVVEAEKLTKEEQLQLAAKTTIMLGVHGNGLTHLLWMPPTPRSAVIEMFFVGGFARDYQWTAQTLGIKHFAVRHDKYASAPDEPQVDYPEGFQGTGITVVGEVVAQLIDDRLAGKI